MKTNYPKQDAAQLKVLHSAKTVEFWRREGIIGAPEMKDVVIQLIRRVTEIHHLFSTCHFRSEGASDAIQNRHPTPWKSVVDYNNFIRHARHDRETRKPLFCHEHIVPAGVTYQILKSSEQFALVRNFPCFAQVEDEKFMEEFLAHFCKRATILAEEDKLLSKPPPNLKSKMPPQFFADSEQNIMYGDIRARYLEKNITLVPLTAETWADMQ
jgi:hypothetical protein